MRNAGFQIGAKFKKCVDCEKDLSAAEDAFLCEQFRTLARGQGFVQRFGSPGALGALDGLDLLASMRGEEIKHHVMQSLLQEAEEARLVFEKERMQAVWWGGFLSGPGMAAYTA
jgi:hypothetical protein